MNQAYDSTEFARVLLTPADDAACGAVLDALEAYTSTQIAHNTSIAAAAYPVVAQHLDVCVACAESYALLYDALTQPGVQPAHVPAPDLRFLGLRPGVLERVGTALRLTIDAALLAAFPPSLAGALRSTTPPIFDLRLGAPDAALTELHLTAYPNADAPERCDLRVLVVPAGREWPDLGGIQVMLRNHGSSETRITDQYGEVIFAGIVSADLAELVLEVTV